MHQQLDAAVQKSGAGKLDTLLRRGDVWTVE